MYAIISSRLDYCNSLFFGINKSIINNLQKVQNAATRLILRRRKTESITHEIRYLYWLRMIERIAFKIIMIIYKCLNNLGSVEVNRSE